MAPLVLGAFLVTSVGIHLQQVEAVEPANVTAILDGIARALESRVGARPRIDGLAPGGAQSVGGLGASTCVPSDKACVEQMRARLGADEIIVVRVFGGLTKVLIVLQRIFADGGTFETRVSANLGKDWSPVWHTAVAELYPIQVRPQAQSAFDPSAAVEPAATTWPGWAFLGLATATLAGGVGLGLSSRSASDRLTSERLFDPLRADLDERASVHGIAATTLFVTSVVSAVVGTIVDRATLRCVAAPGLLRSPREGDSTSSILRRPGEERAPRGGRWTRSWQDAARRS